MNFRKLFANQKAILRLSDEVNIGGESFAEGVIFEDTITQNAADGVAVVYATPSLQMDEKFQCVQTPGTIVIFDGKNYIISEDNTVDSGVRTIRLYEEVDHDFIQ